MPEKGKIPTETVGRLDRGGRSFQPEFRRFWLVRQRHTHVRACARARQPAQSGPLIETRVVGGTTGKEVADVQMLRPKGRDIPKGELCQ